MVVVFWTKVTSLSCLATHSPNQTKLKFGKELSMLLHIIVNIVTYICQSCNMYFLLSTKVWKLVKASAFAAKLYWLLLLKISTLQHVGLVWTSVFCEVIHDQQQKWFLYLIISEKVWRRNWILFKVSQAILATIADFYFLCLQRCSSLTSMNFENTGKFISATQPFKGDPHATLYIKGQHL